MNSMKKFMEIFDNKRTTESWSEMTAILKDCHQYFKNIPASEGGVILSILFDERKGLLAFLMDALDRQHINKYLEGTIIQTLLLLIPIMEHFSDDYKPYIKETLAALTLALLIRSPYMLKDVAAKTFVIFVKVFKSMDLDFNPVINEWMKKIHLYSIPERRVILHVISVISSYFPQTQAFGRFAKSILHELMTDYTKTYEAPKRGTQSLPTYIEALNNILRNFPPSDEDIGRSIGPDSLYRHLKNLCNSKDNQKNKQLMLAVVNLLSEHLSLFDEYVYNDYEFWHIMFISFVNKRTYEDTAINALRNYYRTMGTVLGRKNSENDKNIFLNLRDSFVKNLSDDRIGSIDLRLAVYGFSQIIEPCNNYLAAAGVEEMFSLIAHRTIPLYSREDDETACFEEIADYQEALSRIIRYLENASIDQIRALTTLCSLMIKRFPELSFKDQQYATLSLNRTIINVRHAKEILYQDFITNTIYDGIVWSCSHMLLIDAELKRDVGDGTTKHPITYKDYVPLWQGLLNPANYSTPNEGSEARTESLQLVVNEIVTTCIALFNTLNLHTRANDSNNVFYDAKLSQTAENKTDFRIFLNLVDLYVDILPTIENHLWHDIMEKFIYEIIKNSYKNPLISGFYKLANVTLASSGDKFRITKRETFTNESFNLVLQYLWNIIDALPRYHQELQISCLQLILNVPEAFVDRIVDRATTAFKISLTLGLTNYEIATTAMTALEHWHKCLGGECPKNFIDEIVPCLEAFLQSEEYSTGLLQNIEETRTRAKSVVTLVDDEQTVEGFQKRILLFFGSLNGEVMSEYIHRRSLKTGATWSKKDLLKYPMPFPDACLDINLDAMLPRIIELALGSGDRRTRVAASEVLHTIVAFMLGKTVHFLAHDNDRFATIYETLCPALLRLACDSDQVITQLYRPLVMQLTHWLSSRLMLNSVATINLVDCLFHGLDDETNSSLRDVSGIYLAEFVHWSIKQSSDTTLAQCPTNINLIVRRIVNFALDPSSRKRVAAAIAFNHLYRILRENEEIVNIFWFEILYAFVKSYDGCNDTRINDSLRHVERVLLEKSRIFNESSSLRLRPAGFSGVRMIDAVKWIFQQCGSLDRNCRAKCMEMFRTISSTVDGCNSSKAVILEYLKDHNVLGLNEILIDNLHEKFRSITHEGLTSFLRTLDLYVWLIRDKLIDNEILFTDINPDRNVIFNCIDNFIVDSLSIANDVLVENSASAHLQEFVRLKRQRCETIITLFDFILVALDVKDLNGNYIPDELFDEKFFSLVFVCSTRPQKLGFDSSNLQLTEQLPNKLEILLTKASQRLPATLMTTMINIFAVGIEKFSRKLFQFDEMIENKLLISENSAKGLILLQKCRLLDMCKDCKGITSMASMKIRKIFNILRSEDLGKQVCFYPKFQLKNYLERLLELLLVNHDIDNVKTIVELLTNNNELYRSDMTIVTHGEYFLSVFKNVVMRAFLTNIDETSKLLEISIKENPENVLRITEALVLFLQRNRTVYRAILDETLNVITTKFHVFEKSVNSLDHRRNVFLNIYAIVVRLKGGQLLERNDDMYRWLLRELVTSNMFKYKIRLIRDFLVCLTNENFDENLELSAILYGLRNERKITNSIDDESVKKIASTETIDCLQNLLKLLPITRSSIVLDAIMNFSMGAGETLCENKVNVYLELYYNAIAAPNVLKSLQLTYKRFMSCTIVNERLDVLRYFLLPSIAHCAPQTMEKFFENNMREIYGTIMQKATLNIDDRRQLFVSKIACYNLIEIMFANLPRDRIDSKDSLITIETTDPGSVDEKFSRRIFRGTLPVRQLRAIEGDDKEIVRLVHCSAYKCSIAIVSLARDERFYVAVFGENRERNQLIWENIIDIERQYELRQTSKEFPKEREKLVNIRRSERDKRNTNDSYYSYVKSYDLATSTLCENLYAYDLHAVNLMARGNDSYEKNEIMSLKLEIDDFNEHECMPLICGLLKHIFNNETLRPRDSETAVTPPKWMSQFRASMWSEHANVRLFMLKIVLNTQFIFRPYAEFFLEPLTNTIEQCLKDNPLNYVIADALVMLVDWREIAIPTSERGTNLARRMFNLLVEKATLAPTRYIVKYNMTIIEMIVDAWHECLTIPEDFDDRLTRMDRTATKLLLIFLTNKMPAMIVARKNVWDYIAVCLANWKIEEETVLQNYEAAGLMLKYSVGMEHYDSRKKEITDILRKIFRTMQIPNPGRLVKCVHTVCKACHELAEDFFQFVSALILRLESTNVVKCLEIFSLVIPKLSAENIAKELNYMQFNGLLENKVLCEKICLKIVEQLVTILETRQLLPLVKLVARYSDHENLDYRQKTYDIFTKLYKKYTIEVSDEVEIKEITNISKRILLSGLLDQTEEMQKLSLNFWSDMTNLRDKCQERLLDILDTYDCGIETNFLQITTLMMLELTRKSSNFETKMFEPLHNCTYNDHDISISWKSRNYESRIPLFAPSLASQLNQRFTQYSYALGTSSCNEQNNRENIVLRSTNAPQFEMTYLASRTERSSDDENDVFVVPKIPELSSKNKFSRRFLADWSDITIEMTMKQEANKFSEQEYKREYLARQRGSVKLYRKYRIGDFPDIEISHSTLLRPLQELVKRDPEMCKNLMITLVRSIVERKIVDSGSEAYRREISERFTKILRDKRQNAGVIGAILEIMFNAVDLVCPWSIVADVAKNDGLNAPGALLIEQSLINEELVVIESPPAKRARYGNSSDGNCDVKERWIELANVYESMNELDVVLGIFSGEMFSKELHSASVARAADNWSEAEQFYKKAFERETGEQTKRHCLQGRYECLSRLGKWKNLETDVDTRIGNFKNLLDTNETLESRWITPWIFRAHTQGILEGRGNDRFLNAMTFFLNDSTSYQRLRELYGEETAVILFTKKPQISRDFVNGSWEKIRQQWIQLSPLAVSLRSRAVVKLRGIHDIDAGLKTLDSTDITEASRELMNYWKNSLPSIRDDLLAWDIHSSYRLYFSTNFLETIGEHESEENVEIVNEIRTVSVKQMLKIIECSLNQRNAQLAKKYLLLVDRELNNCNKNINEEFEISAIRFKFLNAQMSNNPDTRLKHYASSWEKSHEILRAGSPSIKSQIAVRQIITEMSTLFARIAITDEGFLKNLKTRTNIVRDIFADRIDFDNVTDTLNYYGFTNLRKCCETANEMADCHLRLAKYCYERISLGDCDNELSREFVRSTLRAMSGGSEEATHYFPCLLKSNILSNDEIRKIFNDESVKIETWRFLIWQTQILSHLGTLMGNIVMPIVRRMIDAYPNAMVYSLRLVLDTNDKIREDSSILELKHFLTDKREFNQFLEAMEYVVQPELYAIYYLDEFLKNLPINKDAETLMRKLYPTGDTLSTLQSDTYRNIVTPYKNEIEEIMEMPIDDITKRINCLIKRLYESLKKRRNKNELRHYSPWLSEYVGREIEVPGQYTGNKKPMPRYHAKIVKIDGSTKVMSSIRKPIRITVVANDAKNYRFLVKFGEDLRVDQRVEQVFDVMNKTLQSDVSCSQRRLSIVTYQVFPLSGSLGFLQWIDGTRTLREYINFTIDENERVEQKRVELNYEEWIKKAAPGKFSSIQYKETLVRYNADEVRSKMQELTSKIRCDLLRRTFVHLSTSMESFMSMRRNFTSTYGTMCIGQWILGIGDRHVGNTLIAIESGRNIGIDFGSAFGGGIDQSVPELMPFRLTSQIKGLLRPFNEYNSMGTIMIHVLRALMSGKGPLVACLDVVAHEQLNWEEHVNKLSQETDNATSDIKWLPANRVKIVSKKLDGVKSSSIILEQLSERHSDEPYYSRYTAIVNGTDSDQNSKRSSLREDHLSPEEQVQCLIEQATDSNILGRTYVGWAPWL